MKGSDAEKCPRDRKITRRDAFENALKVTRAAIPTVPAPGGIVNILALSDIVLAKVCSHYFDIPDGTYVKAGGFSLTNLMPPWAFVPDHTFPSAYIFHPDPDPFLSFNPLVSAPDRF